MIKVKIWQGFIKINDIDVLVDLTESLLFRKRKSSFCGSHEKYEGSMDFIDFKSAIDVWKEKSVTTTELVNHFMIEFNGRKSLNKTNKTKVKEYKETVKKLKDKKGE